jgi:hypothetical protein
MAGERRRFEVEVTRRPLPQVEPMDTVEVRALLLERAEEQIRQAGRCAHGFRFLSADTDEWADAGEPEPGDERFFATCFRQLGGRPGVVRRVREGEAHISVEGTYRRVAVVLEWLPEGDGWWLACRLIGERAGNVGVFHGEWVQREGIGLAGLPEPFREWLDGEDVESSELSQRPGELSPGELLFGSAVMANPAPDDPLQLLDLAAPLAHREIMENGLRGVQLVTFNGVLVEHFLFLGRLSGTLDDIVRNVGWRGPLDAVVAFFAGVASVDGEDRRSVMAVVELKDGRRVHRVVPVEWDAHGTIRLSRAFTRSLPNAEGDERWLGVEPSVKFDLSPVPLPGSEVPEA